MYLLLRSTTAVKTRATAQTIIHESEHEITYTPRAMSVIRVLYYTYTP